MALSSWFGWQVCFVMLAGGSKIYLEYSKLPDVKEHEMTSNWSTAAEWSNFKKLGAVEVGDSRGRISCIKWHDSSPLRSFIRRVLNLKPASSISVARTLHSKQNLPLQQKHKSFYQYVASGKYTDYEIMHFHAVWFAAILALVGAGEAAAIAGRGGEGGGYRCNGCSGDGLNVVCLDCVAIDIGILWCLQVALDVSCWVAFIHSSKIDRLCSRSF